MAWGKGGSKTLDATATQFDITGLSSESTNLIVHSFPSGASAPRTFEVNGTSGTYDVGNCDGGGAIGHSPNYAGSLCDQGGSWGDDAFIVGYMMSIEGKEKMMMYDSVGSNSNGTAPRRRAWASRSNSNTGALTSVTVETSGGSGSIAGSNFSILGSDKTPTLGRPINIQGNSILVEKDTARRYWFSEEESGSDTNTTQTNEGDNSGIGGANGGWGARFNAGHPLVGHEIRSITVKMKIGSGSPNTVDMTARVYGSTKATLRATSTAVSSSSVTTSYQSFTFVFPSGSRGVIQAGDHIMIVSDSAITSGDFQTPIKSSAGTNTHFTTWQGQTNAFTE